MNTTSRILLTALMCTAAIACSKKVKEVPPVDSGASAPVTDTGPTTPGMYGPEDLDTDACLRQRVVYFDSTRSLAPEFQSAMLPSSTCATARPRACAWKAMPTSAAAANTTWAWASAAATRCLPRCRPTAAPAARSR